MLQENERSFEPLPLGSDASRLFCTEVRWSVFSHGALKPSGPQRHPEGLGIRTSGTFPVMPVCGPLFEEQDSGEFTPCLLREFCFVKKDRKICPSSEDVPEVPSVMNACWFKGPGAHALDPSQEDPWL